MKKIFTVALILLLCSSLTAQIPSPESFFGFRMGSDYKLAGWNEIVEYFRLLDRESDRLQLIQLGQTTLGKPFVMAIISSPENLTRLEEIKNVSRNLSDTRSLSEEQAVRLSRDGKIVVLITCSMHASEVGATQMSPELAYKLITEDNPENRTVLEDVVLLLVPSFNPDGLTLVKEWYDANLETPHEGGPMPWLYHHYVGHDNNRDAFMLTQIESRLMNDVLYKEWFPQVVLDMHQMGNQSSRIFVPPFIDPLNPNTDPLIVWEIGLIGHHMAMDLETSGMSGVGNSHFFESWWEGAFNMNVWWHNTVGILTELASCKIATPIFQTKADLTGGGRGFQDHQKRVNFPNPWQGGWWRLRNIVEYDLTAAQSLLRSCSYFRERFLYNRFLMGKRAVRAGKEEPPFAFLIPPSQRDHGTTWKMISVMKEGGVEFHRAKQSFVADKIPYPPGTIVVLMQQPFRAYAKDLMEEQSYPEMREFEGAPPIRPYDVAGWTLPFQMGVHTVKVLQPFETELELVRELDDPKTELPMPKGFGYTLSHAENNSAIVTNRLLKKGIRVYWLPGPVKDRIYIPMKQNGVRQALEESTRGLSVTVGIQAQSPSKDLLQIRPMRIGLYKPWQASMHEGWTRWVLEQFEFPYQNIHNAELRTGNLRDRYDVIVIPDIRAEGVFKGWDPGTVPPLYTDGIGLDGLQQLKIFAEAGGTLICIDSSTRLFIESWGLPVASVLENIPRQEFFCPGSIIGVEYNTNHPLCYGMESQGMAFFSNSSAYRLIPNFGVEAAVAAKYPQKHLLKSGYLLGEEKISQKAALVTVPVGSGRIVLMGFDPLNRAQSHVTFKLLFNSIFYGASINRM